MAVHDLRVWLVLMKAYRALEREARRSIADTGMCFSDFQVLELLLHKGPSAVNAIGVIIGLTSGSITTAIDRLEMRGLVRRADDPGDRRSRIVHLTAQGGELIETAFGRHKKDMQAILQTLSASEQNTLTRLLKKLGQAAASSDSANESTHAT